MALLMTLTMTSCSKKTGNTRTSQRNNAAAASSRSGETTGDVKDPDLFGDPDMESKTEKGLMTSKNAKNPVLKEMRSCYTVVDWRMYSELVTGSEFTVEPLIRDERDMDAPGNLTMYVFAYNEDYAWNTEDAYAKISGTACRVLNGNGYNTDHVYWIQGRLSDKIPSGKYTLVFVTPDKQVDSMMDIDLVRPDEAKQEPLEVDKPVIYLYPEETMNVNVSLELKGELACTYPKYDPMSGWNVIASPDGRLHNLSDGRNYDYLFWEARTTENLAQFEKAACVAGEDTAKFLEEYLTAAGLNDSEIDDFISFWLPKMESNPYNLISFPNQDYEDMAKLNVVPKPDTEIRVFMVFRALDEKMEIAPEQALPMPQGVTRTGFTVVEWGGTEA